MPRSPPSRSTRVNARPASSVSPERERCRSGGRRTDLGRHDAIYIPRDAHVDVSTASSVDFAECRAPVDGRYPVQVVRMAEVEQTPALSFGAGGPSSQRSIRILIGKNVQAGRLLAGVTRSEPGNWTSWPPHEHAAMLEEIYVYYDMPAPAFGVQFVYTNTDEPETVEIVREGDAVLMPAGYHPNVAIPGHPMSFLWIMAARREGDDRQFGVVNVQPDFAPGLQVRGARHVDAARLQPLQLGEQAATRQRAQPLEEFPDPIDPHLQRFSDI